MKKIFIAGFIAALTLSLCACNPENLTTPDYTMPEYEEGESLVDREVRNAIERMAAQKHVVPELSDSFVSEYLDMDSFEELKQRTIEGVAITNDTANMTKEEVLMWQEIIKTEMLNQYTTEDLEGKKQEIYSILESLAEEHDISLGEYADDFFGLSEEELAEFVEEQAEKYVEHSETNLEENTEEMTEDTSAENAITDTANTTEAAGEEETNENAEDTIIEN